MGDISLSGYKASAAAVSFTGTQTLASLTDNEYTNLSDAIDNSTNKYMFADLELVLASVAFTGGDSQILVYLIPSVDGTNYGDWVGDTTADRQRNERYFVGSFTTSGTTEAQRLILRDIKLPNGLYKWGIRNRANVTLAASGNTLSWRPHQFAAA